MNTRRRSASHTVLLPLMLIALAAATLVAACGGSGVPSAGSSSAGGSVAGGSPASAADVSRYEGVGAIAFIKDQHLYTIRHYGGTGRKLIANHADCAAWSPDGSEIAYGSQLGLFVAKADGSERRRVVATGQGYAGSGVAWSPDGRRIAFSGPGGYYSQLWVVNADGSGLTNLSEVMGGTYAKYAFAPAWSPQGRIFFAALGEIASVNPDGSDLEPETPADGAQNVVALPGFSLSHDGKWLLLWDSTSGGFVRMAANGHGVAAVVVEKSQWRGGYLAGSSWSPDGQEIVFADRTSLYVVGVDGSHLREVPNTEGASDPAWQPLPGEE